MAEKVIFNPFVGDDLSELNVIRRTYKMDFKHKRISGMIDDAEAVNQGIMKAMMTRRFAYAIYDDQYGCDIMNKVGNTSLSKDYFDSDIPVMLEDMLLPDDAVLGIGDMQYEMIDRDSILIRYVAHTIYGDQNIEKVIEYE